MHHHRRSCNKVEFQRRFCCRSRMLLSRDGLRRLDWFENGRRRRRRHVRCSNGRRHGTEMGPNRNFCGLCRTYCCRAPRSISWQRSVDKRLGYGHQQYYIDQPVRSYSGCCATSTCLQTMQHSRSHRPYLRIQRPRLVYLPTMHQGCRN